MFDGLRHESLARYPEIADRAVVISSFGKTYHATGWKIGYCVAPAAISAEIARVHQFVTYSVNGAIQRAYAEMITSDPYRADLAPFYQEKRDLFLRLMEGSRFTPLPCQGTFFQMMDYSAHHRTSATPTSRCASSRSTASRRFRSRRFCTGPIPARCIRFCFAKRTETLERAAERLRRCSHEQQEGGRREEEDAGDAEPRLALVDAGASCSVVSLLSFLLSSCLLDKSGRCPIPPRFFARGAREPRARRPYPGPVRLQGAPHRRSTRTRSAASGPAARSSTR